MIDVTKKILNFHGLIVAIAKSLSTVGLYKGSDEWEELAENAFDILVVNSLSEEYGEKISQQYELWSECNRELIVEVCVGSSVLVGNKSASDQIYYYDEISQTETPVNFSFVEFGNPSLADEDASGLGYVEGLDVNGRVICANVEDCKFFLNKKNLVDGVQS